MLMGALLEIAPEGMAEKIAALPIPGVEVKTEHAEKCGIGGTHVHVYVNGEEEGHEHHHEHEHEHEHHHEHEEAHGHHHDHEHHHHDHDHDHEHHHHDHDHGHGHHHHHGMHEIEHIIMDLPVSERVKEDALQVYSRIAAAESKVHGEPVDQIHFHEVGAMDAVTDVVGNCMLMEAIGADRIVVSPINVGSGSVKCAHGILPVPAPATAEILKGYAYYSDDVKGELCTPTGAALLTYFADEIAPRPLMTVESIGVGVGTKDFPKANIVRAFLGEEGIAQKGRDVIVELSTNIDDMTGEEMGFAMTMLIEQGALDVYQTPIYMKKYRAAIKFSVMCRPEDEETMVELIFRYTKTAGIRRQEFERYVLDRTMEDVDGVWVKKYSGYGVERSKAEYDDLVTIARRTGRTLDEVKEDL